MRRPLSLHWKHRMSPFAVICSTVCLGADDLALNSAVNAQKKLGRSVKFCLRNKMAVESQALQLDAADYMVDRLVTLPWLVLLVASFSNSGLIPIGTEDAVLRFPKAPSFGGSGSSKSFLALSGFAYLLLFLYGQTPHTPFAFSKRTYNPIPLHADPAASCLPYTSRLSSAFSIILCQKEI
jgi:hypothetical protein